MLSRDPQASWDAAAFVPYWDPALRGRRYRRFVKRLMTVGLVGFTSIAKGRVGLFTVGKKNGDLRLIVDARGPNIIFGPPPKVDLASSEALGRFEIDCQFEFGEGDELEACLRQLMVSIGAADVDNCFHRLRVPRELARYFCLEPVQCGPMGLAGTIIDDVEKGWDDWVYPMWLSAPMGFRWSLYLAQEGGENVLSGTSSLAVVPFIHDRSEPLVIDRQY